MTEPGPGGRRGTGPRGARAQAAGGATRKKGASAATPKTQPARRAARSGGRQDASPRARPTATGGGRRGASARRGAGASGPGADGRGPRKRRRRPTPEDREPGARRPTGGAARAREPATKRRRKPSANPKKRPRGREGETASPGARGGRARTDANAGRAGAGEAEGHGSRSVKRLETPPVGRGPPAPPATDKKKTEPEPREAGGRPNARAAPNAARTAAHAKRQERGGASARQGKGGWMGFRVGARGDPAAQPAPKGRHCRRGDTRGAAAEGPGSRARSGHATGPEDGATRREAPEGQRVAGPESAATAKRQGGDGEARQRKKKNRAPGERRGPRRAGAQAPDQRAESARAAARLAPRDGGWPCNGRAEARRPEPDTGTAGATTGSRMRPRAGGPGSARMARTGGASVASE